MKYKISLLLVLLITVFSFSTIGNTCSANGIFNNSTNEIPYCQGDDCGLDQWIDATKKIKNIKTTWDAAWYVTSVVKFIVWFVYLLAVILIIYAWFNIMTWTWDEEKAKKSKTMIIYVIIWIAIIFLAGPIVNFVMKALNG